jgi:hypothetical protein
VKVIPKHLVTYRVFGEPSGPHYAHYDLVGGGRLVRVNLILLFGGSGITCFLRINKQVIRIISYDIPYLYL